MDRESKLIDVFLSQVPHWVCEEYFVDFRYMAILAENNEWETVSALINFGPLPLKEYSRLDINTEFFIAGNLNRVISNLDEASNILKRALNGFIEIDGVSIRISTGHYLYESKDDEFFQPLKIRVVGEQPQFERIDNINKILGNLDIPFDGLADLARWLSLPLPGSSVAASVEIRIDPPVDLSQFLLASDKLQINIAAHKNFDVKMLKLALITIPDSTLNGRMQVASLINWNQKEHLKNGTLDLTLIGAQNVLIILIVNNQIVRRQWVVDANRAKNHRYLAINHYDKELKMLRKFLFDDASKFEEGVATLFYMLGFSSGLCLETDAPDVILSSPLGKLIVVEATTKFKEFSQKIGGLVDRRGTLLKILSDNHYFSEVYAIVVCRQPRDQISIDYELLKSKKIILIAHEEILSLVNSLRYPVNPDKYLEDEFNKLSFDVKV